MSFYSEQFKKDLRIKGMKGDLREKLKLGFKDALRNPKAMFKTTGPEFHTADVPVIRTGYSNLAESEPPTAPVTVKDRLLDKLTKR